MNCPVPEDLPPDLINSITLIKIHGDSVARFERRRVTDEYDEISRCRASWSSAGLACTMPKSPLKVKLSHGDTVIEPPTGGNKFVLVRAPAALKDPSSDFRHGDREDHPDGHVPQFRTKLPCGRVIHTNHTVFLQHSDKLSERNLSENGSFQDVIGVEQGCTMELVALGETALDNHGT